MAKWLKVIITFINNLKDVIKEQRDRGSLLDNIRIQKISAERRNVKNIQDNKNARYYSWKVKYIQKMRRNDLSTQSDWKPHVGPYCDATLKKKKTSHVFLAQLLL